MAIDSGQRSTVVVVRLVAVTLAIVALLIVATGVTSLFTYSGVAMRDRIFLGAERGAGVFTGLLGLAVALLSIWCANLGDSGSRWIVWSRAGANVIAVVVISAAAFSIWFTLSLHVHVPGPNSSASLRFSLGERAWSERLTEVLQDTVALVVGSATLVVVRWARPGVRTGSRDVVTTA